MARTRTSDKFQHIRISIGEGSKAQQILRPISHSYNFAKEFEHHLLLDPTTFIDSHQHYRGIKDQGHLHRAVSIQLQFIWQEYLPTIQKSSPSAQFTLYFVLLHLDRIFGYFIATSISSFGEDFGDQDLLAVHLLKVGDI